MTDLRSVLRDIAADDAPDLESIRRRLNRPQRRFTPVLAAAAATVVIVAAAGTALLANRDAVPAGGAPAATAAPSDPWNAVCFGEANLSTDLRANIGMAQKNGAVNTAPRPEDYFDICGTHWLTGTWVSDPTYNADGPVPPAPAGLRLVACVLPEGAYGIFPGTDTTCSALGLPLAATPDPTVGVLEPPTSSN